jgi:hypothetical protein
MTSFSSPSVLMDVFEKSWVSSALHTPTGKEKKIVEPLEIQYFDESEVK